MLNQERIIIQNLTHSDQTGRKIFNDLSLTLGNLKTGLIGRNGIGKTTLFKLITGELVPTSGAINVGCHLGYCPQDLSNYNNQTVAQFFDAHDKMESLDRLLSGNYRDHDLEILADDWQIRDRLTDALAKVSLEISNFNTRLSSLSNGEITKLWLAKLFYYAQQTDFPLLDEPTNNLDVDTKELFYQMIQSNSKGMLITSHDMVLLEIMDQILVLTEHNAKIYGGNFSFYQKQWQMEHQAKEQKFNDAKKDLAKATISIQNSREKHEQSQAQGRQLRKKK